MPEWREKLRETVEHRTGFTVQKTDRLQLLEQSDMERRMLQKELDLLSYTALNYVEGKPQELKPERRRKLVQLARVAWMKDPQIGAAVDLTLDFVLGRGVSRPRANDLLVQQVLDEFWDDPDNQLVLTSHQAQLALLTDLLLQCNLFFLVFEEGEDGKVKFGILDHDTVETVVRDPDNRLRVLYFVARQFEQKWDFDNDRPVALGAEQARMATGVGAAPVAASSPQGAGQGVVRYYPHWRNVDDALEDAQSGARETPELCPDEKLGDGKVFHLALNRGTEMALGHPMLDRLLRWANALNTFMDARVDMMAASAAFIMKRKVRGTPQQLQRMATQALSRRSMLGMSREPGMVADMGPKAASTITENDAVDHEPFALNTNSPQAQVDAQMLHGQLAAGFRWPIHYTGDQSQSSLATSTSLELPVLKFVERFQELLEAVFRFGFDRAIERAVDTGRIPAQIDPSEREDPLPSSVKPEALEPGEPVQAAYEDSEQDEQALERDLGYEFSMPNPLKRMIGDLVTAVQATVMAFDPTGSNTELARTLLTIVLSEGFELEDPAGAVEKIFPPGYQPPAAMQGAGPPAGGAGSSPFGEFSPDGATGGMGDDPNNPYTQGYGAGNPYGAVSGSQAPEVAMQQSLEDRASELDELLEREFKDVIAEWRSYSNGARGSD